MKNHHKTTEEISYSVGVISVTLLYQSCAERAEKRAETAKIAVGIACVSFHATGNHDRRISFLEDVIV